MPAAWKTPHDWVTGAVVTETQLDEQVRDHALVTGEHVLAQYIATASVAQVDFVQIPQFGYVSLRLEALVRSAVASTLDSLQWQFSSASSTAPTFQTSSYDFQRHNAVGAASTLAGLAAATAGSFANVPGANAEANMAGVANAELIGFKQGVFYPSWVSAYSARVGSTATEFGLGVFGGHWRKLTGPIQAIRVFCQGGNISSGSILTLYGHRDTSTSAT